jgi:lysozyme
MNMTYSHEGLLLTELFEGCRLQSYLDSVGVPTIGYGHTRGVKLGMTITQVQAEQLLQIDVQTAVHAVNVLVSVPLKQHQFDALVDFTFNLGSGSLASSTLLKYLNAGNIQAAALEFPKWDMAGGKHLDGLHRRRLSDQTLFRE